MAKLSLILLHGETGGRRAGPEAVVRSLSAFVSASVDGLIRDAVLAGPIDHDLGFIAEHAGCALAEAAAEADALRQALGHSRGEDLLILYAGHVPEIGATEAIEDILARGQIRQRGLLLRAAPRNLAERILPPLAPAAGLLAPRKLCAGVAVPSFENLVRATRARAASHLRLRRVV